MQQVVSTVIDNMSLTKEYFKLSLTCSNAFKNALPGQFVMIKLRNQQSPLLPRPFSIHNIKPINNETSQVDLLYKVVGETTFLMTKLKQNDGVNILGPLGNYFDPPDQPANIIIVAGGIGVAPLIFLLNYLMTTNNDNSIFKVFLGGKTKTDILCLDEFTSLNIPIQIYTDDGSLGCKGLVTQDINQSFNVSMPNWVYGCGPMGMLKSLAHLTDQYDGVCQISIETIMACGLGACLGCAVDNPNKPDTYLHVCKDGPVFLTSEINL